MISKPITLTLVADGVRGAGKTLALLKIKEMFEHDDQFITIEWQKLEDDTTETLTLTITGIASK